MLIGQLARAAGVDVGTVRHYEREGLLDPAARQANGYRTYGKAEVERLAFIRHCRALDISLKEIRLLLEFTHQPERRCHDVDRLIDAQLANVRLRLDALHAREQQLIALRRRCRTERSVSECGILHELVAAAHGQDCACHGEAVPLGPTSGAVQRDRR